MLARLRFAHPLISVATLGVFATVTSVASADDDDLPPLPTIESTRLPAEEGSAPAEPRLERPQTKPKHCVGWAIVGAIGGAAVGFGTVAGIVGDRIYDSTAAQIVAVSAEGVGAVAGPIATCRLSNDPRIVPAASFVVGGVIVGGTALVAPAYLALEHFGGKSDDASVAGLVLLGAALAGGTGGGYLGYLLSQAREPASHWSDRTVSASSSRWSVAPLVTKTTSGLVVGAAF